MLPFYHTFWDTIILVYMRTKGVYSYYSFLLIIMVCSVDCRVGTCCHSDNLVQPSIHQPYNSSLHNVNAVFTMEPSYKNTIFLFTQ